MLGEAKTRDSYWVERAKLAFAMVLEGRLRSAGMSYADFAAKIGKSSPYVTRVMRGDYNLTIETMVKLARATGGKLDLRIAEESEAAQSAWAHPTRLRVINGQRPLIARSGITIENGDAANRPNIEKWKNAA
jgi:transcriptional regulator with XRE-family HTH domain